MIVVKVLKLGLHVGAQGDLARRFGEGGGMIGGPHELSVYYEGF